MKIGELAELSDVSVDTVRFYERRGMIPEPRRTAAGYRQYDAGYVSRIRFIRRAQELGFTLSEIQELLALRVDETTTCGEVRAQASAKIADVRERIRDLERVERALGELVAACRGRGPTSECPILDAMESNAVDSPPPSC